MVRLTLDGRGVEAPEGATLLSVCRSEGIEVPPSASTPASRPAPPAACAKWK
jgi:predicted molibdopterin-dependent oxidoreductase YjgC